MIALAFQGVNASVSDSMRARTSTKLHLVRAISGARANKNKTGGAQPFGCTGNGAAPMPHAQHAALPAQPPHSLA